MNMCRQEKPDLKIEVETRSIEDVKKVIAIGKGKVFRIMLDNFKPVQITEALQLDKEKTLKQKQAVVSIWIILKSMQKQVWIM